MQENNRKRKQLSPNSKPTRIAKSLHFQCLYNKLINTKYMHVTLKTQKRIKLVEYCDP